MSSNLKKKGNELTGSRQHCTQGYQPAEIPEDTGDGCKSAG